ncbi:MAG: response regulator transcription factor [Actinomycetota bacterium]
MRILVVDDHAGFRRALVTTLGLVSGLEVVGEAGDGEAGYSRALDVEPDVVLMDLSMPGMSGVDAMRMIHRRKPETPVVILTAHADPALEADARSAGASGFIAKGGGLQELVDRLMEVCEGLEGEQVVNGS